MMPNRDPRLGLSDVGDNLIVPERPQLPEINVPQPLDRSFGPLQASLDRIERKLDDINNRLRIIESKL